MQNEILASIKTGKNCFIAFSSTVGLLFTPQRTNELQSHRDKNSSNPLKSLYCLVYLVASHCIALYIWLQVIVSKNSRPFCQLHVT